MSTSSARVAQILLVEDSPEEALLTRETFREAKTANAVHVAEDGEKALRFVRGEGEYAGAQRPDLILLDLNLPIKDGREVLAELKGDPQLRSIPVIVLTTSASDRDRLEAYEQSVNAYIRKPVSLERFVDIVQSIDHFWLGVAALPPNPGQDAPLSAVGDRAPAAVPGLHQPAPGVVPRRAAQGLDGQDPQARDEVRSEVEAK